MSSRREPLGLPSGVVEVVDHDARWAGLFDATAAELRTALGERIIEVHHVGSTSVPGLCAKPILDVLVAVADFEEALLLVPDVEKLGYEFRPAEEIEDRHYFRRGPVEARTHHLSLATPTSRHYVDTLAFRDALRRDERLRTEYARLKLELARRFPHDRQSYIDGKTLFVMRVLRDANR